MRRVRVIALSLVILVAVVAAFGALALFLGPHDHLREAYVPNLLASFFELTLGAAAVGVVVQWKRRRQLAPRRESALLQLERPLAELLRLLQAMYVEATPRRPATLPQTAAEVVAAWATSVRALDLTATPSVRRHTFGAPYHPGEKEIRWMDLLHLELTRIIGRIQSIADRRAAVLEDPIQTAVARLETDRLLELLTIVPELAVGYADTPARTLTPYLGFLSHGGPFLERLQGHLAELFGAFERTAGRAIEVDDVPWVEAVAPFWGYSNIDLMEQERAKAAESESDEGERPGSPHLGLWIVQRFYELAGIGCKAARRRR